MSEVRDVLASEDVATAVSDEGAVSDVALATAAAGSSNADDAERRYLAVLNPLLTEAWQQRSMESFADCLTWTLARIIVALEKPQVAGDILRRIGNYTCRLAESNAAGAEAEKEKKAGRVPH
jgi:hypothetical protein